MALKNTSGAISTKPKQHLRLDAFTGAWAWPLTDKRRWCH